ncbi:hypothetical protein NQZ68_028237 [Dissostichus eleginoides]|nr:hypothetical protein NQZ68_028237 [Dissostichus eleginoides]
MQHMFRSVTSCTKCASIHRLISSLQHSEGEGRGGAGLSQGHWALHHCGMMGSSCPGQAASQPRTARVCLASPTLTERREEGTGAPLPLCNWYQMVPPLLGPDLRAGTVPGHLRAGLEDGQTAVFYCRKGSGREFQSLGAEQLKARAPMVLRRELGTVRSPTDEERRVQTFTGL